MNDSEKSAVVVLVVSVLSVTVLGALGADKVWVDLPMLTASLSITFLIISLLVRNY